MQTLLIPPGRGFPGDSVIKNLPVSVGDAGSIPGLGRFSREGNGTPLQYSCLENPMDWGAWRATVHGVAKSWTRLSDGTTSTRPGRAAPRSKGTHLHDPPSDHRGCDSPLLHPRDQCLNWSGCHHCTGPCPVLRGHQALPGPAKHTGKYPQCTCGPSPHPSPTRLPSYWLVSSLFPRCHQTAPHTSTL